MARAPLRRIKASAGSGKTYALTSDFLGLLAGADDSPRSGCQTGPADSLGWPEILAVTFTNRAATEMKERVLDRLKDMALGTTPPEPGWTATKAARCVEDLLRDFGALNIRTIDSLLHLIVRLAALDLELSPDFDPCFDDNELFAPLLDDLAERAREGDETLYAAFAEACRQVLLLGDYQGFLAGGRVRARIAGLASYLLHHQDDPRLAALAPPEKIAARLAVLHAALRGHARHLAEELDTAQLSVNAYLLKALDRLNDPTCPDSRLPSDSKLLRRDSLDNCLNKASKGMAAVAAEMVYARLREAADAVEREGAILRGALNLMPFVNLASRVVNDLPDYQRKTGKTPASLIPVLAGQTLGGAYGVNEAFCRMGSRLTHILVDEFQDTSVDQWLALKPLVVEALARQGSLAIVGDVKQAIYGWRGGEAALFDIVPEDSDLRHLAPEPQLETLPANWRSRAGIIAWNNAVFSRLADPDVCERMLGLLLPDNVDRDILANSTVLLSHSFADAVQQEGKHKPGGLVRLTRLARQPSRSDDSDDEHALAALLPDRVAELGQRYDWGSICILTRTNPQTSKAAAWLLARGIPVVTQGSLLLAEQPLIRQTISLLAFLDSPDDDNAFWAVLCGLELVPPMAGPDLDTLGDWAAQRALGKRGSRTSLARDFRVEFPEAWRLLFAPLHDAAGLLTPYDTVSEIWTRWQVRERHPEAAGFLLRFLEVLHNAEQQGMSDLAGFLDYWQAHGQDEKAPLPETMNAVSIMTVHKAKGLQFEVVLVPWHDFPIKTGQDPILWEGENFSVLAPLNPAMGEPYQLSLAENSREAMHLLYVAWTRAVSELHCFLPGPDSGRMGAALGELLDPLLPHLTQISDSDWITSEPISVTASAFQTTPTPVTQEPPTGSAGVGHLLQWGPGQCPSSSSSPSGSDWRPMEWLPRLKIYRSPLEDWTFTAKRRGTLMHYCLERLQITGSSQSDAASAVRRALMTFPLPVTDKQAVEQEMITALAWFAALPDARLWLANGTPEHSVLDGNGNMYRVDLLVDNGTVLMAVDYKTGTPGAAPAPEHVQQLQGYLDLLEQISGLPVRGTLVYLDRQQCFTFGGPA